MIIAGTGHCPQKISIGGGGGFDDVIFMRLVTLARDRLRELRPEKVISGMALGWDQALATAALDLHIPLIAAVPFDGFGQKWPVASQYRCASMLAVATEVHTVSEIACTAALQQRNEWMVDRADLMLALWDGSWGGTFNCIRYAEKRGRPVENLWSRWELRNLLT